MKSKFVPGQIVQHILQKEWVLILFSKEVPDSGPAQFTCRTKKFERLDFYAFELESTSQTQKGPQKPFYAKNA